MYTKDGENYFIVDAHVALWDARPENQRNIHGKQFIDCFYDYHRNLSPESEHWTYEEYLYQGGERLMRDLFTDGYVDHAVFQPAHLGEFYVNGFGQTEEAFALAAAHPDKLTYNHYWDPRDGEAGLDRLRAEAERMDLKGVKLYTAEWHGDSRGWSLKDPWAYRYLEVCREVGIRNIHIHKGPTIRPLDRDAFDVGRRRPASASDFTDLNFVVEHVRPAPPRGLLLDRHPGAQRVRRARGGDALHAHPARATSPRSSASSCTGSARTASCSPATTPSGRRAGWWRSSWTSRSPRT